ncbi:MAG: extracellular solute-binding protein [Spirochaetaceae bacterium]|nr:extracellular solute-binding protein [Spirochaetaceae bacterium]MCF7948401.1 extracellular solute-binding protein [Spirochaetia bacterium]MCF7950850.1 extracellular solute-binding protein [Spirochaetaceae bacterium]
MQKRLGVVFVLIISLLLVQGAFAGGQQEKGSDVQGDAVEFTWWTLTGGGGAEDPRINLREEIIADYIEEHPNVKIDHVPLENEAFKQKVQVAIQAGDPPDLFHSWGGGVMIEYAEAGMLTEITERVKNDFSNRIGMGALGVYGYDGKYYGVPYDMGAVGMWYNKAIFNEAGVEIPETWPELLDVVQKIDDAGYIPIALGAGDRWPAHFWWVYLAMRMGGQEAFNAAYSGSGSFADEPFVAAGEKLLELKALDPFQEGYLGADQNQQAALMGNGKAAMELMGQWAPPTQEANSDDGEGLGDDLGWFSFPSVPGGAGSLDDVMGGGNGYVVGKDAPEEAIDFLSFVLQKEYNQRMIKSDGIIPVVEGAEEALKGENMQKIANTVANADYFQLYYDQFLPPAVGETVKDAVVNLLAEQASPAEAAQMIQDSWEMEQ